MDTGSKGQSLEDKGTTSETFQKHANVTGSDIATGILEFLYINAMIDLFADGLGIAAKGIESTTDGIGSALDSFDI